MWVLIGDQKNLRALLQMEDLNALPSWQIASGDRPLPPASVYLDLSGCFAKKRPPTPSEAWWIVHAPAYTLNELPPRSIRLNAWPGFAAGNDWEMAWDGDEAEQVAADVCASLNKHPIRVPDQIGFIGARTLAAIIHEAFLLKKEGAANPPDIDQAMKLGTNYPMGPFEWADKIGIEEIRFLLHRLTETGARFEKI